MPTKPGKAKAKAMQRIRMNFRDGTHKNALLESYAEPVDVLIYDGKILQYSGQIRSQGEFIDTYDQAATVARVDPLDVDFFNVTT